MESGPESGEGAGNSKVWSSRSFLLSAGCEGPLLTRHYCLEEGQPSASARLERSEPPRTGLQLHGKGFPKQAGYGWPQAAFVQAHTHTSRLKARRSSGLAAHPATVCIYALEKMPGRGPSRLNKEPKEPAAAFRFRLHRRPAWGSVPSVPLEGLERDFRQRCWAESGEGSEAGLEAGFGPTCRMVIKEIASWAVPGHVCLQIRIQQNARASTPAPGSQPTLERTNLLQSQNRQEPQRPTVLPKTL